MKIENHLLSTAIRKSTPNMGGSIEPKGIVYHYTNGNGGQNAAHWLSQPRAKASAHLVISRDVKNEVIQLVPFNRKAWHAGPSAYQGLRGLNNHFIGFEIDNMGPLTLRGDGKLWNSYGRVSKWKPKDCIEADGKFWLTYPEWQLDLIEEISIKLIEAYPTIRWGVSHEEIDTRGWKLDPGPAFPMDRFRNLFPQNSIRGDDEEQFVVEATRLNVRGGPGTSFEKMDFGAWPSGTVVLELQREGGWSYVQRLQSANKEKGWVANRYLRRAN